MIGAKVAMSVLAGFGALSAGASSGIDFSADCGPVPPLNEAGQPPMPLGEIGWGPKMFHYLPEAGIRHARLHDTAGPYGGGKFVDISNLFRDFSADENDPKNYDFAFTDELLKAMVTNGIAPFFRLGETIENHAHIRRYRTFVPPDKAKWARICEHVIRHYNEGWANGFRFGMEYWEVWNEPDFTTEPWNPMWAGTCDDFLDLYEITARHLKACFPNLKIGGYGSCGFWAITSDERTRREGRDVRSAARKAQEEYHVAFFRRFLKRVRERKIPFDFFTFHSYSPVGDMLRQVEWCCDTMEAGGFGDVELNLDEWLPAPAPGKLGTARQAAEIAAVLAGAMKTRLGRAMIYDARCGIGNYSPLFDPMTCRPHKAYYAFVAFDELRKLGRKVPVPATPAGVYVAAAADGTTNAAVLVANVSGGPWRTTLDFGDWEIVETLVIDARRTYETAVWPVEVANDTTWLVRLRKRGPGEVLRVPAWPGFTRGIGFGGWLTNYKRFNVLPEDQRLPITEGDLEHFDTYLTEADVARVAAWGFDHVRVGFDQIVLEERPGVWRERTFRRLDDFVGWCGKHGLGVVLNLHKAVGNYCDIPERRRLLDDPSLQARFLDLWLEIERRYHDRPGLAFELLNEVRDVDPEKWNALADRAVRALRAKNPDRWLVVGPICWDAPSALPRLKVWDDPKVVYTFHMYWPNEFTHQRGVLQAPQLAYDRELEYPAADVARYAGYYRFHGWENPFADGRPVDRARLAAYLRPAFDFVRAHPDRILWNGEFGTIRHAPPASRVAYMRDVVSLCREHGIPWCVWNYLSTPNDGNRFSLVDDDTREFLSPELLRACLGLDAMR